MRYKLLHDVKLANDTAIDSYSDEVLDLKSGDIVNISSSSVYPASCRVYTVKYKGMSVSFMSTEELILKWFKPISEGV